jgi:hypothetical protein
MDRLYKAMAFMKSGKTPDLSGIDTQFLRLAKLKMLYVIGGWAYGDISSLLTASCLALRSEITNHIERLVEGKRDSVGGTRLAIRDLIRALMSEMETSMPDDFLETVGENAAFIAAISAPAVPVLSDVIKIVVGRPPAQELIDEALESGDLDTMLSVVPWSILKESPLPQEVLDQAAAHHESKYIDLYIERKQKPKVDPLDKADEMISGTVTQPLVKKTFHKKWGVPDRSEVRTNRPPLPEPDKNTMNRLTRASLDEKRKERKAERPVKPPDELDRKFNDFVRNFNHKTVFNVPGFPGRDAISSKEWTQVIGRSIQVLMQHLNSKLEMRKNPALKNSQQPVFPVLKALAQKKPFRIRVDAGGVEAEYLLRLTLGNKFSLTMQDGREPLFITSG